MALKDDEHFVSPTLKKGDLPRKLTFDDKVRIFEDRVRGWQLKVGLDCYYKVPDGGFGALYITLSYFELFARYKKGSVDHAKAGKTFREGFQDFATFTKFGPLPEYTVVRDLIYEGTRCGLYHVGTTTKRVYISGQGTGMFDYQAPQNRLVINPEHLIKGMLQHFENYIKNLRDPLNVELRKSFEKKFDHDILPQII